MKPSSTQCDIDPVCVCDYCHPAVYSIVQSSVYGMIVDDRVHVLFLSSGKDATIEFEDIGHSEEAIEQRDTNYLIGRVKWPSLEPEKPQQP